MEKIFNIAGPCNPADHYMLPAMARLPKVMRLVEDKSYFVVHAQRQCGKTTALRTLAREIIREKGYDQVCRYMDHLGQSKGWLVVFDPARPWRRLGREALARGRQLERQDRTPVSMLAYTQQFGNRRSRRGRSHVFMDDAEDACDNYEEFLKHNSDAIPAYDPVAGLRETRDRLKAELAETRNRREA